MSITHTLSTSLNQIDDNLPLLSVDSLRAADHGVISQLICPCQLPLLENECLVIEEIVRFVPGRRLVGFGIWRDKPVVAKVFFNSSRAKRQSMQEVAGIERLNAVNIPTPTLYYQGMSADQKIHVLLFERLLDAKTLAEHWQTQRNIAAVLPLLRAMCIELATQHVLGIVHHDLHLKNFLVAKKRIYTLDGAEIQANPFLLPKQQSMENIALFIAQFGAVSSKLQERLFYFYANARGWVVRAEDLQTLQYLIRQQQEKRWQQYAHKIERDSSQFMRIREWRRRGMLDRAYAKPELLKMIHQPQFIFSHKNAIVLKAGRSSTVVQLTLDERRLVIKRYNIKNGLHFIRRAFRKTRAAWSWRISQKLILFGISTAKPIAFWEERRFGLRHESYFVMEYLEATPADQVFARASVVDLEIIIQQVTSLLLGLLSIGLTQGDLKLTNILIDAQQKPAVIDLDGAIEHKTMASLKETWKREWGRLLKNFHDRPQIIERFKAVLAKRFN